MTRVTGRVALPYGRSQATTPVCGHVRYVWLGGVSDQGGQVLIPGVAQARIIDGVVEDINLSPGRWLPALVVDGCRYDLPEIIVEASDAPVAAPPAPEPAPLPPVVPEPIPVSPAPVPEPVQPTPTPAPAPEVQPLADGGYAIPGATIATTSDGTYAVEFEGAHYAIAHTGDGNYEMKER